MEHITKESPVFKREALNVTPTLFENQLNHTSTIVHLDNLMKAREVLFKSDIQTRAESHKKFLAELYLN